MDCDSKGNCATWLRSGTHCSLGSTPHTAEYSTPKIDNNFDEESEIPGEYEPAEKSSSAYFLCHPLEKLLPQRITGREQLQQLDQKLIDRAANRKRRFQNSNEPVVQFDETTDWGQWPMECDSQEMLEEPSQSPKAPSVDLGVGPTEQCGEGRRDLFDFNEFITAGHIPQSTSFAVTPPSLVFVGTRIGGKKKALVKLKNIGRLPRRIGAIHPLNPAFDIIWGAELNKEILIPSGLTASIWVVFKPLSKESIKDFLTILIQDDDPVIVPIIAASAYPPVLETEEWDCGCSSTGRARISQFQITNLGAEGRFWILTESEFEIQCLASHRQNKNSTTRIEHQGEARAEIRGEVQGFPQYIEIPGEGVNLQEINGEGLNFQEINGEHETWQYAPTITRRGTNSSFVQVQLPPQSEINYVQSWEGEGSPPPEYVGENAAMIMGEITNNGGFRLDKLKMDHLYAKPFKIYPSCFHLQRNQTISLKARYRPMEPGSHVQKLAILCDNGEVRWIVVCGIGLDPRTQSLVKVEGDWSAPPCHLPTDLSTRLIVDCGNRLGGELSNQILKLSNESCIPLYFFWSIRPILSMEGDGAGGPTAILHPNPMQMQSFFDGTMGGDDDDDWPSPPGDMSVDAVKIFPAQGILDPRGTLTCEMRVQCPEGQGYHSCVLSLFVQQIGVEPAIILNTIIADLTRRDLNDIPVHYAELVKNMPLEYDSDTPPEEGEDPPANPARRRRKRRTRKPRMRISVSRLFLPTPVYHLQEVRSSGGELSSAQIHKFHLTKFKFSRPTTAPRVTELTHGTQILVDRRRTVKSARESAPAGENEGVVEEKDDTRARGRKTLDSAAARDADDLNIVCNWPCQQRPGGVAKWLKDDSALLPMQEIEVWIRSVPLDVVIFPPFITASGNAGSILQREFEIRNENEHPLTVSWGAHVCTTHNALIEPDGIEILPNGMVTFKATVRLQRAGQATESIRGTMTLPFTNLSFVIPIDVQVTGPVLETLTTFLDFGMVPFGTEKIMTFALKNTGNQKITWRAQLAPDPMRSVHLSEPTEPTAEDLALQRHINKLAIVWPEWGTLEPDEVAGGQVMLKAELHGKVTAMLEVTSHENPRTCVFIPVFGEIQSKMLVLKHSVIRIRDVFPLIPSYCSSVTLINPTGFGVQYQWEAPIGGQRDSMGVAFEPNYGLILPREHVVCRIWIMATAQVRLDNFFIPCCVEGMKGPLLLQLEGQISGLVLTFKLPCTRPPQIPQADIDSPLRMAQQDLKSRSEVQALRSGQGQISKTCSEYDGEDDCLGEGLLAQGQRPWPSNTEFTRRKSKDQIIQKKSMEDFLQEEYAGENLEDDGEGATDYNPPISPSIRNPDLPNYEERVLHFPVTRIGQTVELTFSIQNHSPLRAAFCFECSKYNADSWVNEKMTTIENLIERKMMSRSPNEVQASILNRKFGVAFVVHPRDGYLEPFAILKVRVQLYANLWGVYHDELRCYFEGVESPYTIYLEALVTGCSTNLKFTPTPPVTRNRNDFQSYIPSTSGIIVPPNTPNYRFKK